ncbi:MAG: hypothetical protein U5L11_03380 [Arhodomonas sp.]|nr:hypothetical protein [Arhodomonas sp.]
MDAVGERLLARAKAPITATAEGYVPLDIDVFVMDNSAYRQGGGLAHLRAVNAMRRSAPISARRAVCGSRAARRKGAAWPM